MMHLLFTNMQLLFHNTLIDVLGVVDYLWIIMMFLSAVWTLILTAPIHCRGSTGEQVCNATFLKIWTHKETNSTSWMAWVCVNVQPIIIFGWTIPFTKEFEKKSNLLKGIVHPKMKVLSSFTQPKLVPNLYKCLCSAEHKGRYFEESL